MAEPILTKITELPEMAVSDAADQLAIVDASDTNEATKTKRVRMDKLKLTDSTQITDGIVSGAKIASGAVTSDKLGTGAVTAGKVATGGVSATAQITDGIVTYAKLQNVTGPAVVGRAVNTSGVLAAITASSDGSVLRQSGTSIGFGTVVAAGLASNAVEEAKILNGAVTTNKLAAGAVTQAKLGAIKRMIMIPVFGLEDAVIVKNFTRIMAWHPDLNGHVVTGAWAALLGHVSDSGAVAMNLVNAGGTMCSISIAAAGWSAQSGTISTSYDDVTSLATFSVNITASGSGAIGLTVYLEVTG